MADTLHTQPPFPDMPQLRGLTYVFSTEGGKTVAHCLNLDLVASGDTQDQAQKRLDTAVVMQIATAFVSGNWSILEFEAPAEFWELTGATPLDSSLLALDIPRVVLPVERQMLPVSRFEMAVA
jgi:hypothetical protein